MILTCGITHTHPRSEAIVKALREHEGWEVAGGCGRQLDLTNPIQQAVTFRCVECGRWLCKPCIVAHFTQTRHDKMAV